MEKLFFCGCLNNDDPRYSDTTLTAYAKTVSGRNSTSAVSSYTHVKGFYSFFYDIKVKMTKTVINLFTCCLFNNVPNTSDDVRNI